MTRKETLNLYIECVEYAVSKMFEKKYDGGSGEYEIIQQNMWERFTGEIDFDNLSEIIEKINNNYFEKSLLISDKEIIKGINELGETLIEFDITAKSIYYG